MSSRTGKQSVRFNNTPYITGAYSVVGEKEGKGPLGKYFDHVIPEEIYGEKTWEKAETKMLKEAFLKAIMKSGSTADDIDVILSGDLLNQLMASSFMARDIHIPFLGLYGACSTMAEAMILGGVLVDGGYAGKAALGVSSHYCTAQRQFRMPLEHGNQRAMSAQWTATASAAMVISSKESENRPLMSNHVRLKGATIGKVIDTGIKDQNQMGAAMAPAAVDTMLVHFDDFGISPDYYDIILTGDLGFIGREIAKDLLKGAGIRNIDDIYNDCGAMIYDKNQDVHGGGSGCGCSACVYASYVLDMMRRGDIKRAMLISTGALLSTISPMQGESVPGIAHCITLEV